MIVLADCAVVVSNAEVAAQWWADKLGFSKHIVGGQGHALMVAPPGERFILHLCAGFEPVDGGNTGIAFVSDEAEALARRMVAAGVTFVEPFVPTAWGGSGKFADPDGNIFWLLGASTDFVQQQSALRAGASSPPASRPVRRRRGRRPSTPTEPRAIHLARPRKLSNLERASRARDGDRRRSRPRSVGPGTVPDTAAGDR